MINLIVSATKSISAAVVPVVCFFESIYNLNEESLAGILRPFNILAKIVNRVSVRQAIPVHRIVNRYIPSNPTN